MLSAIQCLARGRHSHRNSYNDHYCFKWESLSILVDFGYEPRGLQRVFRFKLLPILHLNGGNLLGDRTLISTLSRGWIHKRSILGRMVVWFKRRLILSRLPPNSAWGGERQSVKPSYSNCLDSISEIYLDSVVKALGQGSLLSHSLV